MRARSRADGATEGAGGREQRSRSGGRSGGDGSDHSPERAERGGSERGRQASRHVVEAGQSLWLIAESVLGDDAGDARVAADVERLWQLNAERIGTGDPDLIYPGQELRLT
jgi:nucleoid-associated protein YgaU